MSRSLPERSLLPCKPALTRPFFQWSHPEQLQLPRDVRTLDCGVMYDQRVGVFILHLWTYPSEPNYSQKTHIISIERNNEVCGQYLHSTHFNGLNAAGAGG